MKTCTRCGNAKAITEFSHHPKTKDGLAKMCQSCIRGIYAPEKRSKFVGGIGNVYLIAAENGLCKIGITDNITRRFRLFELQSPASLVLVMSEEVMNADYVEHELHCLFQEQRSHGEWFRLSSEQIEQAKEILWKARNAK